MKKIIPLIIIILAFIEPLFCQESLLIEGKNIWIRETPVNGKVIMKLNDGDKCIILEKGESGTIRGNYDYWYKIDYNGKEGWVFGSQTSVKTEKSASATVKITGYYTEPKSIKNDNTIILEGYSDGEYVEIIIQGEIFDFEFISLKWEEDDLAEDKVLKYYNKLANQVIVIKTYMPEGIPSEMIRWKSASGKTYEHIIYENNMADGSGGNQYLYELE